MVSAPLIPCRECNNARPDPRLLLDLTLGSSSGTLPQPLALPTNRDAADQAQGAVRNAEHQRGVGNHG
jgi:hypothetical protein